MFEDLFFGPLLTQIILGASAVFLFYWYSSRNHDYWEKKGIPYIKPLPLVEYLYKCFAGYSHEIEEKRYKKLGKIYGHFVANRPTLSVAEPSLLRDIFSKDFQVFNGKRISTTGCPITDSMVSNLEGEDWKRVRSIITPTFTPGKLKVMLNIFQECSNTLVQNFHISSKDGKPVDTKKIYGAFTMDVIASTAFSTKLDSHNNPENKFVKVARGVFTREVNWRPILYTLFPQIIKLFKININGPTEMKFFMNVTQELIDERKKSGQEMNDFLQLLLDSAKEVKSEQKLVTSEKEKDIATNKCLSMDEVLAQCVIFFIAGYDTAASVLSFATYLLALNPDKQDLLRKEVDEVIKQFNGKITYEAIQEMKYLDNVLFETLRIYPPGTRTQRIAGSDYKLGDTGITVPKGMVITIPIYAIHKDPKIYPNPEKFEPDRFTAEERAKRDPYEFIPFGGGPRNCVAMKFAIVEIKACLANVIANFKIKTCPQTKIPLGYYRDQVLMLPKEILLHLEARTDSPLLKIEN